MPAEGAVKLNLNETPFIGFKNLDFWYGDQLLFRNLSWSWAAEQWTCLLGQSGIGKTSLLRLLAGLGCSNSNIQGQIGRPSQLAYLGQNDALLPWLSVYENAILSARMGPYSVKEKEIIIDRANWLLQRTGLAHAHRLYPRELSGGMRQHLALVRTLAEDKAYVLLDEPFSRLDAITRRQLQDLAAELLQDKTVLLVTHDPQEALRLGDRIELLAGCPARIETLTTFSNAGPRELNSLELIEMQKMLYQALSDHYQQTQLQRSPTLEILIP